MKKTLKKDFLLLLFCSFAVFAGKNKVNNTDIRIEQPLYSYSRSFIITFSEPVQRLASDKIPIIISPKIYCNWVWIDAMNLSCNLENYSQDYENNSKPYTIQSFQKATTYKLKLKKGFRGINNLPIKPQTKTFTFFRPQLNSFSIYEWLAPNSPILKLVFNQKIKRNSLKNKIYLEADGTRIALSIYSENKLKHIFDQASYSQTDSIFFSSNKPLLKGKDYHLVIKKGVKSLLGKARMQAYKSKLVTNAQEDFKFFRYYCIRKNSTKRYQGPCYVEDSIVVLFKSLIAGETTLQCKATENYKFSTHKLNSHFSRLQLKPLKDNMPNNTINLLDDCFANFHDVFGRKINQKKENKINIKTIGKRPALELNLPLTTTITNNQKIALSASSVNLDQFYWHVDKINNQEINQTILVRTSNESDKPIQTPLPLDNKISIPQADIHSMQGYISIKSPKQLNDKDLLNNHGVSYLIQKTPFLINFRYNANHAYLQLNDIQTGNPIANKKITLLDGDNSYHGTTDKEGRLKLKIDIEYINHEFSLQFSHKNQNFLLSSIENNFNTITKKHEEDDFYTIPENSFDAYGMTDKPLYRPGEKVKFKFYLRQKSDKNYRIPKRQHPLKIYIDYVNSQCQSFDKCRSFYVKEVSELDEFGGFYDEFTLPKSSPIGYYRINYQFKNTHWNLDYNTSLGFKVSNFKGSDYKVTLDTSLKYAKGKQKIPLHAIAEYYSGGFVANEEGQIAGTIVGKNLHDIYPQYDAFTFGDYYQDSESFYSENLEFNDKGEFAIDITPPENDIEFGQIKLNAGLKPKNDEWNYSSNLIIPYRQKDFFLGLKFSSWALQTNETINLENILIDYMGQEHTVENVNYTIKKDEDSKFQPLHCQNSNLKTCMFKLTQAGNYELVVKALYRGKIYKRQVRFWIYAPFLAKSTSQKPKVTLISDKKTYAIGEIAHITIKFPVAKIQASVVAERNQVLNSWVKRSNNGLIKIHLKIAEKHVPGFDVSALFQPLLETNTSDSLNKIEQTSLTIKVKEPQYKKLFSIKTNKETYTPKEKVKLKIKSLSSNKSSFIVAVIDQSIVDLTDPQYDYNLNKTYYSNAKYHWNLMKANQIKQRDSRNISIVLYNDGKLIDNGDWIRFYENTVEGDAVFLERVVVTGTHIKAEDAVINANSFPGKFANTLALTSPKNSETTTAIGSLSISQQDFRTLFTDAAFFKSDIYLNANTAKTIEFQLPDNITQWQIIVLGTDKTGRLEFNKKSITASKELELRSTLPLQITQGDRFSAEFSVVSKLNEEIDIKVAVQAKLDDQQQQMQETFTSAIKLQRNTFSLPVKTMKNNTVAITALATTKKDADGIRHNIAIRPAQVKLSQSQFGQFTSSTQVLSFKKPEHLASSTAQLCLTVSSSLMPNLNPVYDYIHDYDYSCWEQEIAKAVITAIEAQSNTSLSSQEVKTKKNFVQSKINNAQNFQAANGGMTFWNGRNVNVNFFLSLYTLDNFRFLKTLGYAIPQNVYQNLNNFSQELLNDVAQFDAEIPRLETTLLSAEIQLLALKYVDNIATNQVEAIKSQLYKQRNSLNLFALNQLLNLFNQQKTKQTEILKLMKNKFYFTEKKYTPKMLNKSFWYLLPSANKIQCDTIISQLQLTDELINKNDIFKHLYGVLDRRNKNGSFGSTIENSYCAKALYLFAKKYEKADANTHYQVQINEQQENIKLAKLTKKVDLSRNLTIKLSNQTNNQRYYTAKLNYHVTPESIKKQNHGFSLLRYYYVFSNGKWKKTTTYKTGDWVKTELIIHTPIARNFVALNNPVPGGWLPIDTSLANNMPIGIRESERYLDNSVYFYERQLDPATTRFFADFLPAGTHKISYYSQIRNAGVFTILPALVEEMYDEENRATTQKTQVKITKS